MLNSILRAAVAVVLVFLPCAVHAQPYPSRAIRMVVPSTPGDAPDVIARLVSQKLSEAFGQQVVVENRPGAGGVVGSEVAAKSPPDGYTLIMGNAGSHGINAAVYSKLPYDIARDFAPVCLIAISPNVLIIHPAITAKSVAELIALAKGAPGRLNYASGGNGSSAHMSMELFKAQAGVDLAHIPYKGSTPAITDVIGGQVAGMFVNLPPAVPHIRSGKVRAIAVSTLARSSILPDVPTVAEAGLAGFETVAWFGVLAPAGTPGEIVARVSAELARISRLPDVRERLAGLGAEPVGSSPEEFATRIRGDIAKWTRLANAAGIRAD